MKKIQPGVDLMFFIILIAAILPASLWYASPWRTWQATDRTKRVAANRTAEAFALNVSKVAVQHYGKLGQLVGATGQTVAKPDAAISSAAPGRTALGMGGGGTADAKMVSGIMPPFEFKNYKFEYKGELSVGSSSAEVLRRIKTINTGVDAGSLLASLNFGPANLSSFSGMAMQSASFIQKEELGYNINISFDDGSVSIGQNWEMWPAGKCGSDQSCFDAQRVKYEEVPSDADAIAIAESFVKDHGINISMFGAPEVNNFWRTSYDAAPDKASYYLPETVDVVYPLELDKLGVYDEYSGQKQGLVISVHVKTKRVASAYGLTTQAYESSSYESETDTKKILSYAEVGGINSYRSEGAKTETLELGEPTRGFIRYYNYVSIASASLGNRNEELLVPALIFPIKNIPKDDPNFYRTSVIVPLVKEVLDERLKNSGGGPVRILMEDGASAGAASTAPDVKKK